MFWKVHGMIKHIKGTPPRRFLRRLSRNRLQLSERGCTRHPSLFLRCVSRGVPFRHQYHALFHVYCDAIAESLKLKIFERKKTVSEEAFDKRFSKEESVEGAVSLTDLHSRSLLGSGGRARDKLEHSDAIELWLAGGGKVGLVTLAQLGVKTPAFLLHSQSSYPVPVPQFASWTQDRV